MPLSLVLEQMWKISQFLLLYSSDSGLFGVPLSVLLEQDQKKVPGTKIPLIFQKVNRHEHYYIPADDKQVTFCPGFICSL